MMTLQSDPASCFVAPSGYLLVHLNGTQTSTRNILDTRSGCFFSRSVRSAKFCRAYPHSSQHSKHFGVSALKATVERLSTNVIQDLNNWLPTAGISLHCVEIQSDENGLRGLYATRDINPGDTVLTIPHNSALVASRNSSSVPNFKVLHGLDASFWNSALWHTRLAITLLDNVLAPDPTFFNAYTTALPPDPNTALNAIHQLGLEEVDSQLREFQMTDMARQFYEQTVADFKTIQNGLSPSSAALLTLDDYVWAVSIVFSRAFGCPTSDAPSKDPPQHFRQVNDSVLDRARTDAVVPPGDFALFPGLDMANHSIHAGTTLRISALSPHLAYDLIAGRAVEKGHQVFVSYGPKSNEELIVCYGFVEADSPEEKVKERNLATWISTVVHDCPAGIEGLLERRETQLERRGLLDSSVEICYNLHALDSKLMRLLRVAVADDNELSLLEADYGSDAIAVKLDVALSLRNEVAAWRVVEKRCTELLEMTDEFSENELDRLQQIHSQGSVSLVWQTSGTVSDGKLLLRRERARVLRSTIERVRHFIKVSLTIGRVCTVLLPPTQSVLKADAFDGNVIMGMPDMRFFELVHKDVEADLDNRQRDNEM